MEPTTKKLRPYQVRLVTDVCRATEHILVEQPTGSGKTVQIVTLVAMHLGRRFTHAVISAPQEQIEQGFVKRDYQAIAFTDCQGVAQPVHAAPELMIRGARMSGLGSVKQITAYLRQAGPLDYTLACTHAALNQLAPERLPEDLTGKALFIDEAHHASADGLSEIVALWRDRGGQLFFFTATPYRGDGRPVRLEGMRPFRRSLAEHMAEGFAPRQLESEIVALGQPGDAITAGQFTGEEAPPNSYFEGLVAAISRRWLEDGKPKAIVRVPPMHGGRSGELVSRLTQALVLQGARVLDATGTGAADKQRFLNALEAEKGRTHATSTYDVMVGIQRVLEGTDWPVCSAVYCVGMPGSLNTVVQFLGRAMRLKGEDYPAAQRDRARLVFFVPCGGGAALADLSIDHSRHALLTCCFLADHEVGQEWIVLREDRRGIEAALGSRAENPAAADAENEADEPLDPEVRAEVELVMASAREQIVNSGGEPTIGQVVQLAAKTRPDLPDAALHRVAAEVLAAQTSSEGAAVREAIQREVASRLRIDPKVKQAMAEAFAVVLDEFRDATLNDSAVLQSVGRQIHGVTGGQMREFARRLFDAVPRPLTKGQILVWADAHYQRMGDWPKAASGPVDDAPEETWKTIDNLLRIGLRGLKGGSSLAQLLAEHRAVRNPLGLPQLTTDRILAWADEHYQRTGNWPRRDSGVVAEAPGETWGRIDSALLEGHRGLAAGSSLTSLLANHRGVRKLGGLPKLTEEQILTWADNHHRRTGQWPLIDSGPIDGGIGETWRNIDAVLRRGGRGLPKRCSLPRLLAERRGVRHRLALPALTVERILAWVDADHERTGKWPTSTSGPIHDVPGETWNAVSIALAQGLRGLPGGSSLAKLLAHERNVPNSSDLPTLSENQILEWADAYYERTGKWPRVLSGPIDETGETWHGVNSALYHGLRGLPGGSSLAKLLSKHRTVRNHQNLAPLTEEQILAWVDAYYELSGKWPKRDSGTIDGAPDEKWVAIDAALQAGSRTLPGGSSLAQLLAKYRGVRNRGNLLPLTVPQVLAWADAYHERTGGWPRKATGSIDQAIGETWANVDAALKQGHRGLPGGSSLAKLFHEQRGARNHLNLPKLTNEQILSWADAHYQRTGRWPQVTSGPIHDAPNEIWSRVNTALVEGLRGLSGGSSLVRLITEHRGNPAS
jgi:superfamily II DNA or RNA helicase/pyrroloquinoline quinone (PQQ) biosynthesis protein C